MTYLNLMYRAKANQDYANPADLKADLAAAQEWTDKAMGTRKANEAKKAQAANGGISMGSGSNQ
ncbi:MAG: hypothetical protein KGL37_05815 [Acidobacteriota bacterium]|nr:hypothetical protein [Acidobacteriota bacterium]